MSKLLFVIFAAGFFLLPLQFGSALHADHWGALDSIQRGDKIMIRAACKGEEAMSLMFEALQKDATPSEEVKAIIRRGDCRTTPVGIVIQVYRVLDKGHDWEGDAFVVVEILGSNGAAGIGLFSPVWENQLMPES